MPTLEEAQEKALEAFRKRAPAPRPEIDAEACPEWFHEGQREAWFKEEDNVLLLCGTQSGKTVFGPWWMLREMQRRGPGEYGAASPSFPLMYKKLQPEYVRVFCRVLGLAEFVGSPAPRLEFTEEGSRRLFGRFEERTVLWFYHASDPDVLESATLKAFHSDECGQQGFAAGAFEAIDRRLAIERGRHLMTTTPYEWNHLKYGLYDRWVEGDPHISVVNFRSVSNPRFPADRDARAREVLPEWRYEMMYGGRFTRPAGQILDCFSRSLHLVPDFVVPAEWRVFVGLDFGPINTAATFYAEDPASAADPNLRVLYGFDSYKPAEARSVEEHVAAILAKAGRPVSGLAGVVGGAPSEDEWRSKFVRAGLPVVRPAVADVEVGLNALYAEISGGRLKWFESLDGRRHPRRQGIVPEIESYSWELDEHNEPIPGSIKDKARYHRLDSTRVLMAHIRGMGQQEVRQTSRLRRGTYRFAV